MIGVTRERRVTGHGGVVDSRRRATAGDRNDLVEHGVAALIEDLDGHVESSHREHLHVGRDIEHVAPAGARTACSEVLGAHGVRVVLPGDDSVERRARSCTCNGQNTCVAVRAVTHERRRERRCTGRSCDNHRTSSHDQQGPEERADQPSRRQAPVLSLDAALHGASHPSDGNKHPVFPGALYFTLHLQSVTRYLYHK